MATGQTVYQPPEHVAKGAHVDSLAKYKDMYDLSLKDPEVRDQGGAERGGRCLGSLDESYTQHLSPPCSSCLQAFWGEFASQFHWNKKWDSGENFHK